MIDVIWELAELIANGTLSGLVYALTGVGIVIVFKATSVPNLAQGALTVFGAYFIWALIAALGLSRWFLIIPIALSGAVILGFTIEKGALRRLHGQPMIMLLMMTLGLEILIESVTITIWGAESRPLNIGISGGGLFLGDILIDKNYLFGGIVSVTVFGALYLYFRTPWGIELRALADDYTAAWAVGIRVDRLVAVSWVLATCTALASGLIWGVVQGVSSALGLLLFKSVTVAVLGGLDSIIGALMAGILLGIVENLASGYLDSWIGNGSRDLVVALILVVTIIVRPHGMFGQHEIERV